MTEYRIAKPEDKNAIIDFINMVFSMAHEPHEFGDLLPKAYAKDCCFEPEHFIAVTDGRIEGCVGLLPVKMTVLGEEVRAGIVGSVSAHPHAHGAGHMKGCMALMLDYAKKNGFQMLYLGGRRQRYEYFGFSQGGMAIGFDLDAGNFKHAFRGMDASAFTFEPVDAYAAQAAELYNALPVHGQRDADNFAMIARSWNCAGYAVLKNGMFAGYLIGTADAISEMTLMDENDAQAAVLGWKMHGGANRMHIDVPVWNTARVRLFSRISQNIRSGPFDMFRILDWETVIRLGLSVKATFTRLSDGETILGCDGTSISVSVHGNRADVHMTGAPAKYTFDHLEAQDLLMATHRWVDTSAMPAFVEQWFPLAITGFGADGF